MNGNTDESRSELSTSSRSRRRAVAETHPDAFGNGTCSGAQFQPDRPHSHDSNSTGFNSFLKWFKRSPVPGDRPHSQPPPTPPRSNHRTTGAVPTASVGDLLIAATGNRSSVSLPNADSLANFGGISTPETLSPASSSASASLSLSSLSSRGSVYSTATNGFAFIPPEEYAPFGAAFQPEKRIAVGPVTDTYRQRLSAHQRAKETDRRLDLNLSQKYNLIESDTISTADDLTLTRRRTPTNEDRSVSLQPTTTTDPTLANDRPHVRLLPLQSIAQRRRSHHRRTCSDSSKDRRAGAYVHVKGKRKAPEPPKVDIAAHNSPTRTAVTSAPLTLSSTLARRKRQAPAPPTTSTNTITANIPADALAARVDNSSEGFLFSDDEIQTIMSGNSTNLLSEMERSDSSVLSTDTLRLEHGMLRQTDSVTMSPPSPLPMLSLSHHPMIASEASLSSPLTPISPRPWYKRSAANNRDQSIPFKREVVLKTMEKRKNKSKGSSTNHSNGDHSDKLPDIGFSRSSSLFDGFFARVTASKHSSVTPGCGGVAPEKRRSAIGIPNISELDREAAEIIRKEEETAAQQMAERASAMDHDKYFEFPVVETGNDDTARDLHQSSDEASVRQQQQLQQRRTSTKELISRFEETNPIKQTLNTTALDDNAMNRYFADASACGVVTNVAPASTTTTTQPSSAINVAASTPSSPSLSAPPPLSAMSANGTTAQNRALSPPPKPARVVAADAPTTTTAEPQPSSATSMMQRINSNGCGGGVSAINSHNTTKAASPQCGAKNTTTHCKNVDVNSASSSSASTSHASTTNDDAASSSAAVGVVAATWICSHCTLENYNWRVLCEVCERMRPFPKPEATIGPDGELVPVPRFRYSEKRTENAAVTKQVNNEPAPAVLSTTDLKCPSSEVADAQPSCLIDSSAVVTTQAQVFVAPFPAKHSNISASVESASPNLNDIRAARIEKFAREKTPPTTKVTTEAQKPQPSIHKEKPTILTDPGSLEREKKRLREMIREMNAKAMVYKYPIKAESPSDKRNEISKAVSASSEPVPIPVGRGALRKIPQQRKNESPEDKVISDTTNYIFNTAMDKKTSATKSSKGTFGTSPPPLPSSSSSSPEGRPQRPNTLLNLPSPIAELSADEALLASGPSSPTTQQRLVDEQIDSIYAKLKTKDRRDAAASFSERTITRGLDDFKASASSGDISHRRTTDTLALNKLLKNLEHAIGEGEHEVAAKLAMDLARMKVSLSVTKQQVVPAVQVPRVNVVAETTDSKISNVSSDASSAALEEAGARGTTVAVTNGWTCPLCTLINDPERPGCAVCSETRPLTYNVQIESKSKTTIDTQPNPSTNTQETAVRLRPNSNDLNKTSINRRSAEIFNIIIANNGETNPKPSAVNASKPTTATTSSVVMSAMTPSPNITRTKYRGVDNYNPHVNKTALVPNINVYPAGVRKSTTPYKSPLARTNGGVKITAVTLKTGENIPVNGDSMGALTQSPTTNQAIGGASKSNIPVPSTSSCYTELLNLDNCSLVPNTMPFECAVCFGQIAIGGGVVLRECLHTFCRECLAQTARYSEEAEVRCPYMDDAYSCESCMQEREVRGLLSREEYERHLAVSLSVAELRETNAFHCKTPGCRGWCIYEDNVNEFRCPICKITNCLTCRVVHDGLNCKQYQDRMNNDSDSNEEARRTSEMLNEMIDKGEAMKCPVCQVILMKKWGCDWLKCSMCKTEICWVTRGIRWGPEGKGDNSAGCRCGVNGTKCHPKCNYCH